MASQTRFLTVRWSSHGKNTRLMSGRMIDAASPGSRRDLYRALDSRGQTIDFLLPAKRDTAAAKRFLRRAIDASGNPMPRVMNVDKNPAYPAAVEALKAEGTIPRRVVLRQCKYLNNKTTGRLRNEFGWPRGMDRFRVRGGRCRESRQ